MKSKGNPAPRIEIAAHQATIGMRLYPGPGIDTSNVRRRGETITRVATGLENGEAVIYIQGRQKNWVWTCGPSDVITVERVSP
jgi:hypothetical protein